jgi:hypothetical protein
VSPDDVSLDWEKEITAIDGIKIKSKETSIMKKFFFTYFINESFAVI